MAGLLDKGMPMLACRGVWGCHVQGKSCLRNRTKGVWEKGKGGGGGLSRGNIECPDFTAQHTRYNFVIMCMLCL